MSESVVQFNRVFAEVNRSQCRYRLLCGGAGSGKSMNTAQDFILKLSDTRYRGANLLVVRKTEAACRYSVFEELVGAVSRIFGSDASRFWHIRQEPMELTSLVTGGRIIFRVRGVLLRGDKAVDFSALRADGIRFAVLSATAGGNRITPRWAEYAASARRAGIGVAICHDLDARSVTETLAEADHFLRVLDTLDFPPLWAICRVESPRLSRDPSLLACMVRAFTERVRGGGFRPMLYTTESYLPYLPLSCDLYLARWSVPEARALARNPRIWEYGEGKAGDIPHAILLRGYFSSLPESGGDFLRAGEHYSPPLVQQIKFL